MARVANSSRQTESVLRALLAAPGTWRHGYDLSGETGLKSGTLYPMLIRLQGNGWLEARWDDEAPPGRPRRHLYRLTGAGAQAATAILGATATAPSHGVVRAPEGGTQ
jgi:PadR family transcriptional regulator PadR